MSKFVRCDVAYVTFIFCNTHSSVAVILSKYRSGKLPKAFKVIPHLQNWEEVYGMLLATLSLNTSSGCCRSLSSVSQMNGPQPPCFRLPSYLLPVMAVQRHRSEWHLKSH